MSCLDPLVLVVTGIPVKNHRSFHFSSCLSTGIVLVPFPSPYKGYKDSTERHTISVIICVFTKSLKIESVHSEALDSVFQGSLKSEDLQVQLGGVASIGASRTLGNRIFLQKTWLDSWQSKSIESLGLLIHEAVHAWQYQSNGWRYAPRSLWEQFQAKVRHGTRREAYSYDLEEHKEFLSFGIEQQAQMIQDWYLGSMHNSWENAQIHCKNFDEIKGHKYAERIENHLQVIRSGRSSSPKPEKS